MGILEKTLGTVENVIGAVGDIAKSTGEAVEGFLSDKAIAYQRGKQLAELEEEFEADTDRYRREKSRLESKIRKGTLFGPDIASQKKLAELEEEYSVKKEKYELKKNNILSKKSRKERERDMRFKEMNAHSEAQTINKKCIACSAPLVGKRGQIVCCKYCDTNQTL